MRFLLAVAIVVCELTVPAAAQPKLEFEVASVRSAGQPSQECFGKTLNPPLLHYGCYSIIPVIMDAYGIESYRLAGIEKAENIYVDITATMKPGTTKVEMQQMLQNLLAERFHLKVKREVREGTVYELSVDKGGAKLKERFDDPPSGDVPNMNGLKMGPDGMPDFPAVAGRITGGFGTPLKSRAIGTSVTMADLAAYFEVHLKAPIIDMTGLKGKYDFRLDYMSPTWDGPNTEGERFPPLPNAFSSQLGLLLKKTKGPVTYIAIESLDKTPTDN
jgi:uncharacterized protein (TIGR03435 family)